MSGNDSYSAWTHKFHSLQDFVTLRVGKKFKDKD